MQTDVDVEKVGAAITEGLKAFLIEKTNSRLEKVVENVKVKMYWVNKTLRIDLA